MIKPILRRLRSISLRRCKRDDRYIFDTNRIHRRRKDFRGEALKKAKFRPWLDKEVANLPDDMKPSERDAIGLRILSRVDDYFSHEMDCATYQILNDLFSNASFPNSHVESENLERYKNSKRSREIIGHHTDSEIKTPKEYSLGRRSHRRVFRKELSGGIFRISFPSSTFMLEDIFRRNYKNTSEPECNPENYEGQISYGRKLEIERVDLAA